jgi:hypothetical protein
LKDGSGRIGVGVTEIVLGVVCVIMVNVCDVVLDVVCVIIMDVCYYGKEIQFSKLVFTILVNKQNYYYMIIYDNLLQSFQKQVDTEK